jgi:hypothetical protein
MGTPDRDSDGQDDNQKPGVARAQIPEAVARHTTARRQDSRNTRRLESIVETDDRAADEAGYGYGV